MSKFIFYKLAKDKFCFLNLDNVATIITEPQKVILYMHDADSSKYVIDESELIYPATMEMLKVYLLSK